MTRVELEQLGIASIIEALRHQRRTFGANGFYGNSPSKEWTDQTLASLRWARVGERWTSTARAPAAIGSHRRTSATERMGAATVSSKRSGLAVRGGRLTAFDGSVDVMTRDWTFTASPFVRWDEDVIDWIRNTPAERWQTTNVRDATTTGAEMSATRPVGPGLRIAINTDYRSRADGQQYWLVAGRISREFGRYDAFIEGSNLLNEPYREIAGVPMPGRWLSVRMRVR